MNVLLLILALVLLFFSTRSLNKQISRLVYRLGGSTKGTIILWSFIFLPGTIIHEISHFLLAAFTGARTGKIEIFPEFLDEEFADEGKKNVTLGYVQTSRLNPIQGFLVGLAPFFSGLGILLWLSTLIPQSFSGQQYAILALETYFFFTVSNSFFPSWADIRQTLTFIILFFITLVIAWFYGATFLFQIPSVVNETLLNLSLTLSFSLGLNLVFIFLTYSLNHFLRRR